MSTAIVRTMKFDDAGAFSKALSKSNVVCMQTTAGALEFGLTIVRFAGLELHLTSLPVGGCIAVGDAANDSVSFHVPLSHEGSLCLMGLPAAPDAFAAYTRGGELAVRAGSGARLAYIVPDLQSFSDFCRTFYEEDALALGQQTGCIIADTFELNKLKMVLDEIAQIVRHSPAIISNGEIVKNLEQSLLRQLLAVARAQARTRISFGRAHRSNVKVVKTVQDYLHEFSNEPVYVLDLCRAIGISQPTLFRAFRQILGMGPKEYLQARRLHLSRQRFLHDCDPCLSVHAVAYDLGFWHLGRFGIAYRELFGEAPSETLRRTRSRS